jgi:hypothetical protein
VVLITKIVGLQDCTPHSAGLPCLVCRWEGEKSSPPARSATAVPRLQRIAGPPGKVHRKVGAVGTRRGPAGGRKAQRATRPQAEARAASARITSAAFSPSCKPR